jgi:CubicO group peptidase (beta-lactamase class C family)
MFRLQDDGDLDRNLRPTVRETVMAAEIGGYVEPGFEGAREAFAQNFAEFGEVGAGFALYVEGHQVVDLWGGTRTDTGSFYDADTLQVVFSSTKGATAACAHLLAQRGLLDLDAPVVTYWPEFGHAGKEHIPVRWLLSHQAGLPTIDAELSREEVFAWDPVIRALEAQAPLWEPGSAHGYHALTYGHLVGELVRRVDGRSLGTFFHEEFAVPLGLEFWIGLPEQFEPRVAPMIPMNSDALEGFDLADVLGGDALIVRAMTFNGAFDEDLAILANYREFHAAELPAANGITNARSLARFYAGLIGHVEEGPPEAILTREQVDIARVLQTSGFDRVLSFPGIDVESTMALGFSSASPFAPMGGAGAFGHYGAGGSVGFADPEHRLAGGYVMNKMGLGAPLDPRSGMLVRASYDAAGATITHG